MDKDTIRLAHGGGGSLTNQLIQNLFLHYFDNEYLEKLNDSAILNSSFSKFAFTTDSFVVSPLFFPGGDIGKLSVCGTVNDLCVSGAKPLYLSIGFIIEEGFSIKNLEKIVKSIKATAQKAGVLVVTGDTKVVEHGKADGVFINTTGIGEIQQSYPVIGARAKPGDKVIISGPVGSHGMSVITSRENFGFNTRIKSDVAPLHGLVEAMLGVTDEIHVMRDATRGGVATVFNEIADQSGVSIVLDEEKIPVNEDVRGACEILGFDPLYIANEGVLVACVGAEYAEKVVNAMKKQQYGKKSIIIGNVDDDEPGKVSLKTTIGSHRVLDMQTGEQLPRIC
ncbi:MAG: hydrogenase expression/formation protein HypE [bacterium]